MSAQSSRSPRSQDPRGGQKRGGLKDTVKAPLIFSAALGVVGGLVAAITASGGTDNPLRVDIGLIAFGVFFVVSLVVVAMLQLASRENPEHLSQGSGVNRSSAQMHQKAVDEWRARERSRREGRDGTR
ncbi:hypothetical protein ACL90Y_08990 [Micrococcus luteus]